MRKKIEPVIVHKIGVSGMVKDSYMGVIIGNDTHVLPGVNTLDEVRTMIKNNKIQDFLKKKGIVHA